jgi:pantoate--beta-alanine ligase
MRIVHTVNELRSTLDAESQTAFVPTMGNLHEGHIGLVRQALTQGRPVVASIFVNPLQFGQGEDFERYPRTLAADADKLSAAGCDILFAPDTAEMYPEPQSFQVIPPLDGELCGAFRPGHFAGVCTVVLKLFDMVQPRYAVFGKKDFQQLFLIKGMVRQFNLPIDIVEAETARASDGLALSSRNGYLSETERREAPRLVAVLRGIAEAIRAKQIDLASMQTTACEKLAAAGWRVDYIEIRSRVSLLPPSPEDRKLVILGAAWLNKTRLIDNIEIER